MRLLAVFVCSAALLAGCRREQAEYFPLEENSARQMRVHVRTEVGTETSETTFVQVVEVVRGRREVAGLGNAWVVETPIDSGRVTNYFFRRTGDTVFMLVPGRGGSPQRVLYLLQPLHVGMKWYDSELQRELNEVVARESVVVPAGTFHDCFKVVQTNTRVASRLEKWFAPGVGVVKRVKALSWVQDSVSRSLLREEQLVAYRTPPRPPE